MLLILTPKVPPFTSERVRLIVWSRCTYFRETVSRTCTQGWETSRIQTSVRTGSNGIENEVSRRHIHKTSVSQTFKVYKYRPTTGWFIFNIIPGYQGGSVPSRIVPKLRHFHWLLKMNNQLNRRNSKTILHGTDPTVSATASRAKSSIAFPTQPL